MATSSKDASVIASVILIQVGKLISFYDNQSKKLRMSISDNAYVVRGQFGIVEAKECDEAKGGALTTIKRWY